MSQESAAEPRNDARARGEARVAAAPAAAVVDDGDVTDDERSECADLVGSDDSDLESPAGYVSSDSSAGVAESQEELAAREAEEQDLIRRLGPGRTFDGQRFFVPKTWGPMNVQAPWRWSALEWVQKLSALNLLLVFLPIPRWTIAAWFILWRLAYNVGIGLVLRWQSNSQGVTRMTERVLKGGPQSTAYQVLQYAACQGMGSDYSWDKAPLAFTAWLPFRHFVDIILANDLMAYFAFVIAYWDVPETIGVNDIVLYAVGLALNFFSLWAKSDSYRVVKDFAWYWGDFFFLIDGKLSFDRVFRIAPHPMYTIGYSFFYGCSLLSHSYTVLYVSLAAHFMQMIFLALCETPHMKKIYPEMVGDKDKQVRDALLYDKTVGYFQKDLLGLKNFNPFRFSDIAVLLIVSQHVIYHLFTNGLPLGFYIAEVLFWRLVYSGVLGVLLHKQGKDGFLFRLAGRRGLTKRQAFDHWKGVFNLSHTMTLVSFALCSWQLSAVSGAHYYLKQVIGSVLVLISFWTSAECYEVLGDYGWFYGDFFIDDLNLPPSLYYHGVYRFMDNPDAVVGYAGFYGMALIAESRTMLVLAMFSQLCHFLFVVFVERPHMYKKHGENLRANSGISSAVREILIEAIESNRTLKELNDKAQAEIDQIKANLLEEIDDIREEFGRVRLSTGRGTEKLKQKVKQWRPKKLLEALERVTHSRQRPSSSKKKAQ
eukprot:m51a1_g3922 putative phosphatidylethanolamine n-methyltransferase (709) ;mRNA; r:180021-182700